MELLAVLTSYAQNFEDVVLWRALKHVENGFYIDIGAQDPVVDSVSLAFYERGWRGIHVEPTPTYAAALRAARPDERVIEAAVAPEDGIIPLYEIAGTGLSTGRGEIARLHEAKGFTPDRIDVGAMSLSAVLEEAGGRDVHWMKIDVEGMEREVVDGWLPSAVRPWVLVIESTQPLSQEPDFGAWEADILALGYSFVYFDGLNRFYVHGAHEELVPSFGVAPNFFDDFVLGRQSPFARGMAAEVAQLEERADAAIEEARAHADRFERLKRERLEIEKTLHAEAREVARLRRHLQESENARATEIDRLDRRLVVLKETHAVRQTRAEREISARQVELDRAANRLQGVYESTSWRITAPLRAMRQSMVALVQWPKDPIRGLLEEALYWLRLRPRALAAVRASLRLTPPLERRAMDFARKRPVRFFEARRFWTLEPDPEIMKQWLRLLRTPPSA